MLHRWHNELSLILSYPLFQIIHPPVGSSSLADDITDADDVSSLKQVCFAIRLQDLVFNVFSKTFSLLKML